MNELLRNVPVSNMPVANPGLYSISKETLDILKEVSHMLDRFKCELFYDDSQEEKKIIDPSEPKSFTENVLYLREFALGVRSDLGTIMSRFVGGLEDDRI